MLDPAEQPGNSFDETELLRILDMACDGVMVLDSSNKVLYCNKAARRLLNKKDDELLYSNFQCNQTDGHKDEIEVLRDGEVHTVETRVNLFESDSASAVICLRDVTARVALQKTLQEKNEKLIQLNEELSEARDEALAQVERKSQFVANISHEIRAPLSGIVGLADILLLDSDLDEEATENAQLIQQSSAQLLTIVNDILDLSKLEAGHIPYQEEEFRIDILLDEIKDLILPSSMQKDLEIAVHLDASIPKLLIGDAQKIRQSLLNLAHNAIKFTSNGFVHIIAEGAEVTEDKDAQTVQVKFMVKDSGIGIDQDAQKKIFQPYVQADGKTAKNYGGTGLGLSITKHFIELMKGTLKVDSQSGQGATFFFQLSLKKADE